MFPSAFAYVLGKKHHAFAYVLGKFLPGFAYVLGNNPYLCKVKQCCNYHDIQAINWRFDRMEQTRKPQTARSARGTPGGQDHSRWWIQQTVRLLYISIKRQTCQRHLFKVNFNEVLVIGFCKLTDLGSMFCSTNSMRSRLTFRVSIIEWYRY